MSRRVAAAPLVLLLAGCGGGLCEARTDTSQHLVVRDVNVGGNLDVSMSADRGFYAACEAKPVPGYVNVPVLTPYGLVPMAVTIDARGVARAADHGGCRQPALEACEEAVTYFFNSRGAQRPPFVQCKIARGESCKA